MFLTENQFRDALHWYQKKIGSYDQQVWEKSIEERVLRGLSHAIPKKVARVKKESIDLDLDLIRGSYFAKAKPQQSWLTTTYLGIVRILLFPFYLNWWTEQTNSLICAILFILYCLQMISMYIYFNSEKDDFDEIPISEVVSPLFMFFILGTMQSQIGASSSSKNRSYRSRLNCPPVASTSLSSSTTPTTPTTAATTSSVTNHVNKSSNASSLATAASTNVNSPSSSASTASTSSNSSTSSNHQKSREILLTQRNPVSTRLPSNNDENSLITGLCKNCSKRDKETLSSNLKKVKRLNLPLSSSTVSSSATSLRHSSSSIIERRTSTVSSSKKLTSRVESKVSDDESGLDSMETQNGSPKEEEEEGEEDDEGLDKGEIEGEDEEETCLNRRRIINKHVDPAEEDEDVSDNCSTPGSCSPSADQSPSTSSSTKSTPGYSGRRKKFSHQKISDCESAERADFVDKKEVNTDTEPDGTIGDLSSADECSPYSTVDSNNRFEWSRKYNIPSTATGIKIDSRLSNSRTNKSPVNFLLESTNDSVGGKSQRSKSKSSKSSKSGRLQFRLPCTKPRDCSSSGESECSMSPTSPITKLASDLDWPSINSDGTSDEEGEMGDVTNSLGKLNEDTEFFHFREEKTRLTHEDHNPSHNFSPEDTSYSQRSGKTLSDKVSCAIWQMRECQKVDLSVLDISSSIIRKVESVKHSNEYFYLGFLLSLVLAFIPVIFRIRQYATSARFTETRRKVVPTPFSGPNTSKEISDIIQEIPTLATDLLAESMVLSFSSLGVQFVVIVAIIERFFLSLCFFFLLCVAERTFRERFLYAKYFCHLTSSRRARRSDLPHFRLNKVRNIKTWLSVRSYLQNHGPQRSIDAIVSSSFIVEVSILTFLCIQLLRDNEICSEKLYCWEMVFWNLAIGLYIMRLMILGSKMNRKSRGCLTILLSEQINLYLQLEQKPHKKEDLTLANQLIKSAADVLKLLEAPFKISGFSANPYLYNITKVIVLSAFSAVLTELLGFKLKLYKIKLTS
ncbi:putative homeodomain transcription factor 2 [Tetranychus urticae]|nr:putative homeodomain transcription factor 2 [Tetranychus urticae]